MLALDTRRRFFQAGILVLAAMLPLHAQDTAEATRKAEAAARKAMDEFMTAFNSRDAHAWAATLNYPHVRFASNQVRSYATAEEFARESANYPKALAPWEIGRAH